MLSSSRHHVEIFVLTLFPMAHFPTYSLWGWVINVSVIALKLMKICRNKTSQVSQKPTKTEVSI